MFNAEFLARWIAVATLVVLSSLSQASDAAMQSEQSHLNIEKREQARLAVKALSDDIQQLKTSVVALNKDIRTLEEDMLFPANTQLTVFVSLDVGTFFGLETVKLKLDGNLVTSHIYSDREVDALTKSGIHRLFVGNLSQGNHELTAFFTGVGPHGRPFKRGTTLKVEKGSGVKYVELHIGDSASKEQPEFSVKQW